NHWQLVVICNKGDNDMPFLMLLDSLHMGEPTRIENELKNFLKIAYEGKEMRAVADELKVIDLHVPKLTADWFSREEYEKFREDLQGKRIHIDARSASTSKVRWAEAAGAQAECRAAAGAMEEAYGWLAMEDGSGCVKFAEELSWLCVWRADGEAGAHVQCSCRSRLEAEAPGRL
ncbi:hypothetical protein Taro_032403, partial [Colocasia esculenta]|nr:hypothetical protein [Colocasia esculenta]